MIEFKPLSLSDKPWIDEIVFAENSRSADYNFGNIYMWDETYKQHVAKIDNRYVVSPRYDPESCCFVCPVGTGDFKSAVEQLRELSESRGYPLILLGVTKGYADQLEDLFPGKFECLPNRDYFDYIYLAEKMATMSGKKLHGKRNHINRFVEENDWSFEPITKANIPDCMDMLTVWTQNNSDQLAQGLSTEHVAIERAFDHFEDLQMEGGLLRSSGKVIAFSFGERISSDTFNVHVEKAYADIQGAYPMVTRELARQVLEYHPEIVYINREDDMGMENLRQAKQSFYPDHLLEKYTANWII